MGKGKPGGSWFVKGDLDGFFGLGLDNLIQFILIGTLCRQFLDMPDALVVHRIFPGAALSILFGNLFYAWQARRLARRAGRDDVTAIPYGINTVSLMAFLFFIMQPVYRATGDVELTWRVGILACFLSGVIELSGALVADRIRKVTPRAALLSALAGIAMTFISMDFLFRIFRGPDIAMFPMIIILAQYFSRVRYPLGIPGGLLAVAVGTVLFWLLSHGGGVGTPPPRAGALFLLPHPSMGDLWRILRSEHLLRHLSIIVPMGILNVVGSLQNIESAEAAGDPYPAGPSLSVNGAGSILAALFGSCFPTTIYIGHPGWKALGARSGYSILNGLFVAFLCFTGSVSWVIHTIPLEAGVGILLWIGIVICAQAFQATPSRHGPAVAFGLFPCLAAWGKMMLDKGLASAGSSFYQVQQVSGEGALLFRGILSLDQGFLFTAMIFSSMAVFLIEREFRKATAWALVAAACSFVGLIHAYRVTPAGVTPLIGWGVGKGFAVNYLVFAAFFLLLHAWRRRWPAGVEA